MAHVHRVRFYEPIEYASRTGATVLDYAVASERTKQSRGCVQERRFGYLKALDERTHADTDRFLELVRQTEHGPVDVPPSVHPRS